MSRRPLRSGTVAPALPLLRCAAAPRLARPAASHGQPVRLRWTHTGQNSLSPRPSPSSSPWRALPPVQFPVLARAWPLPLRSFLPRQAPRRAPLRPVLGAAGRARPCWARLAARSRRGPRRAASAARLRSPARSMRDLAATTTSAHGAQFSAR